MDSGVPRVSVVIPSYNAAKYICQALESVFSQTFTDFEVIVIDDGSIDDTQEVLTPYMGRITYFHKENGGPASARNVGIRHAQGEYLAFLDADDIWLPDKIEQQVDMFNRDDELGLVHSDCIPFRTEGELPLSKRPNRQMDKVSGYIFPSLFRSNSIRTLTVMVKRETFDHVGLFNESPDFFSVEDYDMWLRISRCWKIGYINDPLAKYRIHPNQISKNFDRSYTNEKRIFEKLYENFPNIEVEAGISLEDRFAILFYEYGIDHFTTGNLELAREKFLSSLKYNYRDFKAQLYYISTFLGPDLIAQIRWMKRRLMVGVRHFLNNHSI